MESFIKQLTSLDISRILQIQSRCYHDAYLEDERAFQSKFQIFPEGCVGIIQKRSSEKLVGYLISFPWFAHRPVHLNSPLPDSAHDYSCYYLHDIAILPEERDSGYGQQLVTRAEHIALKYGYEQIYLVSVQNSRSFWKKQGFTTEQEIVYAEKQSDLAEPLSYLMVKTISPSD